MQHHVSGLARIVIPEFRRYGGYHMDERSFPSHEETLSYVRALWRCILHLVYGSKQFLKPPGKYPPAKKVVFIANLYAYAELLDLNESIMARIREEMRSIPHIWVLVSKNADIFIDLGYEMKMPDLYMDAVKHWTSWQHPPSRGGWERWHVTGAEEKLWALAAASMEHKNNLIVLNQAIVRFLHSIYTPGHDVIGHTAIPLTPCALLPAWDKCSHPSDMGIDDYMPAIKDLFMNGLIHILPGPMNEAWVGCITGWYGVDEMTSAQVLRELLKLAADPLENRGRKAIIKFFYLRQWAEAKNLRLDKLTYLVALTLKHFKALLEGSPAFSTQTKCSLMPAETCGCRACVQPRHQNPAFFSMVDLHDVFRWGYSPLPWPFKKDRSGTWRSIRDVTEDDQCAKVEEVPTEPATFEYLHSIGLETQFSYLDQSRQATSELRGVDDLSLDPYGCNPDVLFDSGFEVLPLWGTSR
jgi:hypothetical protein